MKHIVFSFLLTALLFCSCGTHAPKSEITAEMAFEGVSNYCHSAYDWRYQPLMSETRLGLLIYLIIWSKRMENFEEILRRDLHQFLLSMKEVDERLPECPDVEEKWEELAKAYIPDGIREFQDL